MLEKNQLKHNTQHGVRVESGSAGRLMRNVIEMNGSSGIFCEPGCEPQLGENFVNHNEVDEETPAELE